MSQENQNVWFGISMVLIGVIVGFAAATFIGGVSFNTAAPTAPAAAEQPTAPKETVDEFLVRVATGVGVDESAFTTCLASGEFTQLVKDQTVQGAAAGVNGTPGNILYNLKAKSGMVVAGARPAESFKKYIDQMLASPGKKIVAPKTGDDYEALGTLTPIDFTKDHIRGNPDATVALIEYSDFQCPFCARVHPTLQQLTTDYGDQIMWVYRHYPLPFHPNAEKYAVASECVAKIGGNDLFWKYTDAFFADSGIQ